MQGQRRQSLAGRRQGQQPLPTPAARTSRGACGMQPRMLPLSQRRGFPLQGQHGVLGRCPAPPTSRVGGRPCQESRGRCHLREALPAVSNLPTPPQPPALAGLALAATHHKQKAFDRGRGFEKGTGLSPGHERSLLPQPLPVSRRDAAASQGGGSPPPTACCSPQTPVHPSCPSTLSLKHRWEGSPFPQCPVTWPAPASGCGHTGVPGAGARAGTSHLLQLSPSPVGSLPNLPLNST